jgi:hypothetical protein
MTDTLTIHGPTGSQNPIAHTRSRLGLPAHSEGFERFIADSKRSNTDLKRPMIGCAVTRWKLYPDEDA